MNTRVRNKHISKLFLITLFLFCFSCKSGSIKENVNIDLLDRDANLTKEEVKYSLMKDKRNKKQAKEERIKNLSQQKKHTEYIKIINFSTPSSDWQRKSNFFFCNRRCSIKRCLD